MEADLPHDVALNSLIALLTLGLVALLPTRVLGQPSRHASLLGGLWMGLNTVLTMGLAVWLSGQDHLEFRPFYAALATFFLGPLAGAVAVLSALLMLALATPPLLGVHAVVLLAAWACGALGHGWRQPAPPREPSGLQRAGLLLALAIGLLATVAAVPWLASVPVSATALIRVVSATLLVGGMLELMQTRARDTERLQRNEAELLRVLESSGGGRWELELDGNQGTAWFRGQFYEQFGLVRPTEPGAWERWLALMHPEDRARLGDPDPNLRRRTEDTFEAEYRVRRRPSEGGDWRWILSRGRIIERDSAGGALRLTGMHHDITAQKAVAEALRLSQAKFQTIYHALPDAAGITSVAQGRYIEVNPAFCQLLGLRREEIIGRTSLELSIWASPAERGKLIEEFQRRGQVDGLSLMARASDGRLLPGRMSARHIEVEGEACFIFLFHDMSEQQRVEDRLLETNAVLTQAGRLARLGAWEAGPNHAHRYWSDVCYELHGLQPGSPIPDDYIDHFVLPSARDGLRQCFRDCVQKHRPWDMELPILRTDGRVVWVHAMGEPVIQDGHMVRMRGVIRDIDQEKRNLEKLRQSEERFARILQALPDPMGISRQSDGHYLDVNPAWVQAMGYSRDEALAGKSVVDLGIYTPAMREKLLQVANQHGVLNAFEVEYTTRSGERHTALQSMRKIELDGVPCWLFGLQDITERKQAERQVQEREALLSLTIEAAELGLWDMNLDTGLISGDSHWRALRGLQSGGRHPRSRTERLQDIIVPEDRALAETAMQHHLQSPDRPFDATLRVRMPDGTLRWMRNLGRVVETSEDGRPLRLVGVGLDVTLQHEHEERLQRLAHFDALTGLPNRVQLGQTLLAAMAQARLSGQALGVAYLDLDGFKPVNDRLGHGTGDRLLVEIGRRLRASIREQDSVARLGGDEFVILLTDCGSAADCEQLLARLMARMAESVVLDGESLVVTASIGLTLYPSDDSDADALLRHADQAMYQAKQAGRNRIHVFDPTEEKASRERLVHLDRIRLGLEAGEFQLHMQPKVDMCAGALVGVEALARWQHPEHGLLAPARFLPHIEGSALEAVFGEWVIQTTLAHAQHWLGEGLALPISFNISARHLQTPDFTERLAALLAAHPEVPPRLLEIEITESAALTDLQTVIQALQRLRQMGLSIAIDDFGTGYSSLTYLRQLRVDTLKIDRSFVNGMLHDSGDMAIVHGVIGLSRSFGLTLIAEGVETTEEGEQLLALGCRTAQGYGIARPMPADQIRSWAAQWVAPQAWREHPAPTA